MSVFNVSESIGFDGYSYFCRRCGKAGYQKSTQVRGHLAMCQGTMIRKGVPTTGCNQLPTGNSAGLQQGLANQLQPVSRASDMRLGEAQLLQPLVEANPVASGSNYQESYQLLNQRVTALENEYNHMVVSRNAPASDWLAQNKNWVILIGVFLLAYMMMKQTGCDAQSNAKPGNLSNLGEKIVTNFANRAVTKSVDSLFS